MVCGVSSKDIFYHLSPSDLEEVFEELKDINLPSWDLRRHQSPSNLLENYNLSIKYLKEMYIQWHHQIFCTVKYVKIPAFQLLCSRYLN